MIVYRCTIPILFPGFNPTTDDGPVPASLLWWQLIMKLIVVTTLRDTLVKYDGVGLLSIPVEADIIGICTNLYKWCENVLCAMWTFTELLLVITPLVRPPVLEQTIASGLIVKLIKLYVTLGNECIQPRTWLISLTNITTDPALKWCPTLHIPVIVVVPAVL